MVTGDSGLGKSTLCVTLALELAKQQCRTAICSLELPFQSHIAPKLVSFMCGRNIENPPRISSVDYSKALHWLDEWGMLSIINRVGSLHKSNLSRMLEDVYLVGCRCIVLDHLQFLVTKEENDEINSVIRILVDFLKTHMDFTIILVAHPKKPIKDYKTGAPKPLTMHDLKGSSALYQEPDNVWILNRDIQTGVIVLDVGKLRSDKTPITAGGRAVLYFDKAFFKYNIINN
jgi:hypothetical protein